MPVAMQRNESHDETGESAFRFPFDIVIANVSVEFVNFEHHTLGWRSHAFWCDQLEPVLVLPIFTVYEARPADCVV